MAKTVKKKNKQDEKYLAKRREQKRMSMRRARERIKNDPIKHEENKLKRRLDYQKLKEEGKIKLINDLSSRDQRKIRKEWKHRSQKYRIRQKNLEKEQEIIECFSPPETPPEGSSPVIEEDVYQPSTSRQKDSGKKVARKNRENKNKEIKKLKEKLKNAERKVLKYKSRMHRLKENNKVLKNCCYPDTPNKVVDELLKGHNVSPEVRKRLLFGEVISKQVKENFKRSSTSRKSKLVECVTGKIIKKYKLVEYMRILTSRRAIGDKGYLERKRANYRIQILRQNVQQFLERDDNSRMTAGKKESITKNKEKKQKRYLNDSLRKLHNKFLKENPRFLNLSYSMFCKLRPFWIVTPLVTARDTCLCKVHANFGLLITALKKKDLIVEKTPTELVQSLCCPGETLQEQCLTRECSMCMTKDVQFNNFDSLECTSYEKWVTRKESVMIKGVLKQTQKTIKLKIDCNLGSLASEAKQSINPFMNHIRNIKHQFDVIKNVKETLTEYEALLHFDFSQNYSCKYANEIQSFHFGGSRTQITLHTSVLYYKNNSKMCVKHKSFCSVSESLRHDPAAICAHLNPIIQQTKNNVPKLKKVHFLSDGPSTQYKNKTMFYFFGTYLSEKLGVDEIVWHYSEAGHGKGAADGIGGSIKRLADSLVSRGMDVANFEQFLNALKENCKETSIFSVTDEEINNVDRMLPDHPLKRFLGTMRVHQLTWDKDKPLTIQLRSLSCLKCSSSKSCLHYDLGEIKLDDQLATPSQRILLLLNYYSLYLTGYNFIKIVIIN